MTVLDIKEVADYLRVHPSTIYRALKSRRIPSFKVGNRHKFSREQIDEFYAKQVVQEKE